MRAKFLFPIICSALALLWSCKTNTEHAQHDHDHDHDHHEHHEHDSHGHEVHDHHDHGEATFGGEIVLEPEVAKSFGVETEVIEPSAFHQVVRATGSIMTLNSRNGIVAAPKAGTVTLTKVAEPGTKVSAGTVLAVIDSRGVSGGSSDAADKAALEQARREFERIQKLYSEQLATISELTAAQGALNAAEARFSPKALGGNATSPVSGIVTSVDVVSGQFVEVGQPIATVASAADLQLRIDIPQKDFTSISGLNNAIIKLPYATEAIDLAEIGGKRIASDAIPAQGSNGAYIPVYFQVPNHGSLVPGTAFTAFLTGSERQGVITVPAEAIIEQQGDYFIFEKIDEHGYRKLRVTPGTSDGKRVEITSGLNPGTEVVTKGATTVRLAEASAVIPEGHTHNH